MPKMYFDINVLESAQKRIEFIFDEFEKITVSFSGGKDSTVLLELTRQEASRRNRIIDVLFIDPEAQYSETIRHIEESILNDPIINPIWVCVPLLWRNGLSVFQPHWRSWDENEREFWVRDIPKYDCVISEKSKFPFYDENFGIDEFVTEYARLSSDGKPYASLVGIRSDESFNRYMAIKGKRKKNRYVSREGININWSTLTDGKNKNIANFYPLYDWRVEDIWKFIYDSKISYNKIYDWMYLSGVPIHDQRICQPYGDEQKRGLDQWAKIEPETWARALTRVSGVNYAAKYARDKILGYKRGVDLPEGHTWKSYTFFLLSTLPDVIREKHLANFAIVIEWYMKERYLNNIIDIVDDDIGIENPSKFNIPSWRKLCLAIQKNDFWGTSLDIGVTKYPIRDIYNEFSESGVINVRVSVKPFYETLRDQYKKYTEFGIDAVNLDFEHPTASGKLKKMWRDL